MKGSNLKTNAFNMIMNQSYLYITYYTYSYNYKSINYNTFTLFILHSKKLFKANLLGLNISFHGSQKELIYPCNCTFLVEFAWNFCKFKFALMAI